MDHRAGLAKQSPRGVLRGSTPWVGDASQRVSDSRIIGTERFLVDRQRALVERLGVGGSTLYAVKQRQIVQRRRDLRGIGTERFLVDRQRGPQKRVCFGGTARLRVTLRQLVQ